MNPVVWVRRWLRARAERAAITRAMADPRGREALDQQQRTDEQSQAVARQERKQQELEREWRLMQARARLLR